LLLLLFAGCCNAPLLELSTGLVGGRCQRLQAC
jgi:hypothetical protein